MVSAKRISTNYLCKNKVFDCDLIINIMDNYRRPHFQRLLTLFDKCQTFIHLVIPLYNASVSFTILLYDTNRFEHMFSYYI